VFISRFSRLAAGLQVLCAIARQRVFKLASLRRRCGEVTIVGSRLVFIGAVIVPGAPLELRPTRANGQPAFGCYLHSRAWGFLALTLSGEQIAAITFFSDPSPVGRFGLPRQSQ
jgi:hypothetical protein